MTESLCSSPNHQLDLERKRIQEKEAEKKKSKAVLEKKCIKRMALELKLAKWGLLPLGC